MISFNIAEILNIGPSFTFEGKEYTFDAIDAERQGIYSQYLRGRAWAEVFRAAEHLKPSELQELKDGIRRDAVAGEFDFGGETCAKSIRSRHGMHKLISLSLTKYPDVDDAFVDRLLDAVQMAMSEAQIKSQRTNEEWAVDPKTLAVVRV